MTSQNKLLPILDAYLTRQAYLQGLGMHFETYFKTFAEPNIPIQPHPQFDFILGTNLIISDLTGETDNGWIKNFSTGKYYGLSHHNRKWKEDQLLIDFTSFLIAQAYECLETFIKRMLSSYFEIDGDGYKKCGIKKMGNPDETIKKLKSRNNQEYIELISKISSDFKIALTVNNRNINILNWFEHFSNVRHAITHRARRCDNSDFGKLKKEEIKQFKRFFPYKIIDKTKQYYFDTSNLDYIIIVASEFGFIIFKYISIELGYDWRVLEKMKK
jgi:hypothetical protein